MSTQLDPGQAVKKAFNDSDSSFNVNITGGAGTVTVAFDKADDAAFVPAVDSIAVVGAFADDTAPDSVNEGDAGALRMSLNRNLYVNLRDGAGSERGASVLSDNSLKVDENINVVDLLDTPVIDATTIAGSAGAFLQVVASTAAAVKAVHLGDTSGSYLGLYTGAAASEVLKLVINPGSDSLVPIQIAAGTRVAIRSMEAAAPVSGNLCINFLG